VARVDILFGLAYPDARVRRTAQALADAGYEVRVLAWDREGARPAREMDGRVRIEHARVISRSGRGAVQVAFLERAVWRHLPRMRADPPAVLHAVDLPMLAVALLLRPLIGRPKLVYDAFEIYALMESHKYPGWLLSLVRLAERRLPRRADLVITPGHGRAAYFAERGTRSTVVGNWIDAPGNPPARDTARRELGIGDDRFCIVYAGGLEPSRDLESLVGHARRVEDDLVLVAGRGEQQPAVEAAAASLPNLRFLGWVAEPGTLYAAADALYYALRPDHPYASHPAPNNLYAAIAYAVPIVHRAQGELAIVADEGDIGPSFSDAASLDAAFATLRDPGVQDLVRSSLRRLQGRYSARRAAAALVDAYAHLE
jgi:glycosyltransferase involved in cell wall biosynthesis